MTVPVMDTIRYDPFWLAVPGVPPPASYRPIPGHHAPAVLAVPDLFRVSVTIVTLTRNKSRALAGKSGIPGIRFG
jgi:hypothetical protein